MKKEINIIFFYLTAVLLLIIGIFFDKNIVFFLAKHRVEFLNSIMSWFSFFGKWFIVLIFMTSLFLWQERKRKWILPLWFSLLISMGITYLLKIIVLRARPEITLLSSSSSSFPSGHACAVFSTLAILDKEFPKFKWFWFSFSLIVVFSRLYLGMHYLTDVVVGALIGYTIGMIIVKIKKKKNNKS